jgi:hypothetical protein
VNEDPDHRLFLWRKIFDVVSNATFELGHDVATIGGSKKVSHFAKPSKQLPRRSPRKESIPFQAHADDME